MKHMGDITKIHGYEAPIVDVVIGGSPCQDLSVAGKRAGLAGERSGLFMEQLRIIKEMREHDIRNGRSVQYIRPRYMVWENVPGAFSSNKGEDFRAVLEETARVADKNAVIPMPPNGKWTTAGCIMGEGWSIAWRILDAQFWGVPQRRRRIALVADFGGQSAPEILFERKGLHGDSDESGAQRERASADVEGRAPAISFQERAGKPGMKQQTFVAYGIDHAITTGGNCTAQGPCVYEDIQATLKASGPHAVAYNMAVTGDATKTLTAIKSDADHVPVVTYDARGNGNGETVGTLTGDHENSITDYTSVVVYPTVGEGVCGTLDAHYSHMPGMRGGMERTMVAQEVRGDKR